MGGNGWGSHGMARNEGITILIKPLGKPPEDFPTAKANSLVQ
jgi:hypothetical protein